jgi:hypothetical protein
VRIDSSLPPVEYDGRIIGAVMGVALVIALSPLRGLPDPLANTIFTFRGLDSAWTPLAIAAMYGWVILKRLRRLRLRRNKLRRRFLSFLAGISVCLIPLLFYAVTRYEWTNPAPVADLFWTGLGGGVLLGAVASWYVPASMWARAPE